LKLPSRWHARYNRTQGEEEKAKRKPKPDIAQNALRVVQEATGGTLTRRSGKVKKT